MSDAPENIHAHKIDHETEKPGGHTRIHCGAARREGGIFDGEAHIAHGARGPILMFGMQGGDVSAAGRLAGCCHRR